MSRPFNVREIIGALTGETAKILQEDAVAAMSAVTLATPVGNPTLWQNPERAPGGYVGGHARRSWIASVGRPSDERPPLDDVDPNGARTIGEAVAKIRTYGRRDALAGRAIFIQNGAPYIGPLNDGSSTQAPANFVEQAVRAALTNDDGVQELD